MIKNIKISGYQLAMLIVGFVFGSTSIINPAAGAGRDAWLVFLLGWAGGLLLMWIYVTISLEYPSMTLIDILKTSFGKYLGTVFSLLYIWYFLHLAAVVLRNFGEHMVITIYPSTPVVFTIGCFGLLVAYCLRKGLEVTGRAAEMLIPYLFIFLFIIFLILIPEYDVSNLFPLLERGVMPAAKAAYRVTTFPFGETVAFMMIFPNLYSSRPLKKVALFSVLLIGGVILTVVFRDILSLGDQMLTRVVFPPSLSSELTRDIQLDPLIGVNLLVGGWLKITVCLYSAIVGLCQLFGIDDYKPLVLPVMAFCIALSLWIYPNIFEMFDWSKKYFPIYVMPMQIIIPVTILGITKAKKFIKANKF